MLICKIFRPAEWSAFEATGETPGSPADLADGFIHFSTPGQLAGTLAKHFAGARGLVLAGCDADALGPALRWEPARGGALFPHLYRVLRRNDLLWRQALPDGPDGPVLPDLPQ